MALTEVDAARLNDNVFNTVGPFTNRIINGDMRIDQRNAGASSTATGVYTVDRWNFGTGVASKMTYGQNYNSLTPPAGFTNYMGFKTTTAYTVGTTDFFLYTQEIEGYNVSDLAFGTASAKSFTLSFWVNSSLTGTFGVTFLNSAQNRCYPATYTISSANTWEYKTITIPGDTTGTWVTNNGKGLTVTFNLGTGATYSGTAGSWQSSTLLAPTGATSVVGTLNATWNITGVQLEAGSVATPFERRSYGQELALCQRYYYRVKAEATNQLFSTGYANNGSDAQISLELPVEMRTAPTAIDTSGTASHYAIAYRASLTACSAVPVLASAPGRKTVRLEMSISSGLTQGDGVQGRFNNTSGYVGVSAEL